MRREACSAPGDYSRDPAARASLSCKMADGGTPREGKGSSQKCHVAQSFLTRTVHVTLTNHKETREAESQRVSNVWEIE